MVVGLALRLNELDDLVDLVVRDKTAWIRRGLPQSTFENSMSPKPVSFSAPIWSIMTRESMPVATLKAIRLVMLALIRPVTTLELGRCVAR